MIHFLLEASLAWLLMGGVYSSLLNKSSFFVFNRIYLLGALVFGFLFPFMSFSDFPFPQITYTFNEFLANPRLTHNLAIDNKGGSFGSWGAYSVICFYILGFVYALLKLGKSVYHIIKIYQSGLKEYEKGYTLIRTEAALFPFSFGNIIFIHPTVIPDPAILLHEQAHIHFKHSWDRCFLDIVLTFFWFHPFLYWYRSQLVNLHEYQADAMVLKKTSIKSYGQLLLEQAMEIQVPLGNSFSQRSGLKKRIQMMLRKPNSKQGLFRYLGLIPVLMILFIFGGSSNCLDGKQTIKEFIAAEQMPVFLGKDCRLNMEATILETCSKNALINFIAAEINYPRSGRINGLSGLVIARFTIDEKGKIRDAKIIKPLDPAYDAEVLRMLDEMPDWLAGKQNGKPVSMKMNLPVRFQVN